MLVPLLEKDRSNVNRHGQMANHAGQGVALTFRLALVHEGNTRLEATEEDMGHSTHAIQHGKTFNPDTLVL